MKRQGAASSNPFTLQFRPDIERAYRDASYLRDLRIFRLALFAALIVWSVYAILDLTLFPSVAATLMVVRFAIFPPLAALTFALTYCTFFRKIRQLVSATLVVIAGASIIAFLVIAPPPRDSSYIAGLVVVFLFGYSFSRVRFVPASIAGFTIVVLYVISAATIERVAALDLWTNTTILAIANILCMVVCYNIESTVRNEFLHRSALKADADDALASNVLLEELVAKRTAELREMNDALRAENGERRKVEAQLQYLATHDVLSGLANRRFFEEQLEQVVARAKETGGKFAVLFIDLDRFKTVNDRHGHHRGDELLQRVSQRIQESATTPHTVSRLGGDEFTVLLSLLEEEVEIRSIVHRILDAIAVPMEIDSIRFETSASIGVARFPHDARDVIGLMRCADSAMYQVKANGGNGYQFFSEELDVRIARRAAIERKIAPALQAGDFFLLYQPKVDLATDATYGFEALIRWTDRNGERVGPEEFIPIAEESGAIASISRWVLSTASAFAAQNQRAINVNISGQQFTSPELVATIAENIRMRSLDPRYLCIEITESALMLNLTEVRNALVALRASGIKIAIDDFGTGYSSLSYLSRLPIDELKIDQSFVTSIGSSAQDEAIIRTIISLAHSIGARVVAEGVETAEQLAFLRSEGCDAVQGYLVAKPMSAEDAVAFHWTGK